MSGPDLPSFESFTATVAAVAPRLGEGVASGRLLDEDLGFTTPDLLKLDFELFRRHDKMLGVHGHEDEMLGLTVGQAFEMFVDRAQTPIDRRREALADPVRGRMMRSLRERKLGRRDLQLLIPGSSVDQIEYHLACLCAADLVSGPDADGRYRAEVG